MCVGVQFSTDKGFSPKRGGGLRKNARSAHVGEKRTTVLDWGSAFVKLFCTVGYGYFYGLSMYSYYNKNLHYRIFSF